MDTIDIDLSEEPSYESLEMFLESIRDEAETRDRAMLLSISMPSGLLDPLAVLESIYESNEQHFYVERRSDGVAIAGAECALAFYPKGKDRFAEAKRFVADTLENTIAVGDERLSAYGPHFFCSFSFFPEVGEQAEFPSSTIFVPHWQVSTVNGGCVAIANTMVEPASDVASIAQRIWKANEKFRSIDYGVASASRAQDCSEAWRVLEEREVGESGGFECSVRTALEHIRSGALDKVVVARALDIEANQVFHPLEILNTLRDRYPDCFAFSVANGKDQSFIGASPERLVQVRGGRMKTEALAGSAPRGGSAGEDVARGKALLESEKDRREQALVLESIIRRLESLGLKADADLEPRLKRLQNVQHLQSEVEADLPDCVGIFDLLEQLHPTPAVGGTPREEACGLIPNLEGFERGLYAGAIGWVNSQGEGDFLVSIRSALVNGARARLFAGVGIVDGSEPEKEKQETDLKFQALKENLL